MEKKKNKAEDREFYQDYIYPKPVDKSDKTAGRKSGSKKSYSRKGSGGRKYVIVILIIFMLAGALLLADFLSNGLAIGLFKKSGQDISIKAVSYYAVSEGSFTSDRQAKEKAALVKESGGAGFIYNDGTFHIFSGVYEKLNDAKAAASAAGDGATVYNLNIKAKNIVWQGTKAEKEAVTAAFEKPKEVFTRLNSFSVKIASGELKVAGAYLNLQALETEVKTALDNLTAAATAETSGSGAGMDIVRLKAELNSIINMLSDLADPEAAANEMTAGIKYSAVKVLCSYKDTMEG